MKTPTFAWAFFLGWYALWRIGSPGFDKLAQASLDAEGAPHGARIGTRRFAPSRAQLGDRRRTGEVA